MNKTATIIQQKFTSKEAKADFKTFVIERLDKDSFKVEVKRSNEMKILPSEIKNPK